ncbi:MAG: DUF5715 family protein [Leptospiraceae bacterium]|nr:DUF5715 family protein [Leptospiraceae bacterium]MDW8307581.1 DUF5715 family protein [Leptospiraceae bacterium]
MRKIALVNTMTLLFLLPSCKSSKFINSIEEYLRQIDKEEEIIIREIPIYEDFSTPEKEKELRRYLLPYHLHEAQDLEIIDREEKIHELQKSQEFVSLETPDQGWFFYSVPPHHRYGRKEVLDMLYEIHREIQKKLIGLSLSGSLKFAISSAIRPQSYQKKLALKNPNAASDSSHSYGISVDIFYDEFYYNTRPPSTLLEFPEGERLYRKTGFLLGKSLRRQFHSVLAETILALQRKGFLLAIWEKNQRCYHITPVRRARAL